MKIHLIIFDLWIKKKYWIVRRSYVEFKKEFLMDFFNW